MENNLLNIRESDPAYQATCRFILDHLPPDLRKLCEEIKLPQIPLIATDDYFIHYTVYPMLKSANKDDVMNKILKLLKEYMSSEGYQKTKILTTLDHELSMVHAISLTKNILSELKKELEKKMREMMRRGQRGLSREEIEEAINNIWRSFAGGGGGQEGQESEEGSEGEEQSAEAIKRELRKRLSQMAREALQKMLSSKRAKVMMEKAMAEARKDVERYRDIRELIGGRQAGKEPGTFEKVLDLTNQLKGVRLTEILSFSKKLMDSIPEFTMKAKSFTWRKTPMRLGYTKARKPWLALPKELALPDDVFYLKLQRKDLHQKQYYRLSEGAYYVIVDKSGSMDGEKTVWARSVALAIYRLAQRKRRKFFLRFFDTEVYPFDKPIEDPKEAIEHIIRVGSNGGTSIDNALQTAVADIVERGLNRYTNTIILITDGEDRVSTEPEVLKRNNIRLVAVMIAGSNDTLYWLAKESGGEYMRAELSRDGALKLLKTVM